MLSIVIIASAAFLIAKTGRTRQSGDTTGQSFLTTSAPVLFVLSGLFLANTVINPAESLLYIVRKALCFAVATALLSSGIVIFWVAPHEKKIVQPQQPPAPRPKKEHQPYSRSRLLFQRIVGLAFASILLALPFILGDSKNNRLFSSPSCFSLLPSVFFPYHT